MTALLVLTVGQTDVQLVEDARRRELARGKCASLHDEIEHRERDWRLVDCPIRKLEPSAGSLPKGTFALCTPKLDALLRHTAENGIALTGALILETRRDADAVPSDPRFAGAVLARRLRERAVGEVRQQIFLAGPESIEDPAQLRDAIVRREVVNRIDRAVRDAIAALRPQMVIVATTGGFPTVGNLIEEIVRLHATPGSKVDMVEVADGSKAKPPTEDRARHRALEPAASYRARWHALELIANGNLLGAWGAVQHLDSDEIEHRWTRVIEWLAHFAASTPMPYDCDIPVLKPHTPMAVRAAIRVELALRAQDIPRAVHGTVAFFESALWDHLGPHLVPHPVKPRLYRADPNPGDNLIRKDDSSEDRRRPFEFVEEVDDARWYRVFDDDSCGVRLAKRYLKQESLEKLGQAMSSSAPFKIRELRNDVAHNEPTPRLMAEARRRMIEASLWSAEGRFLSMPLVERVLRDLGEQNPDSLCTDLISTVRSRLLDPSGKF